MNKFLGGAIFIIIIIGVFSFLLLVTENKITGSFLGIDTLLGNEPTTAPETAQTDTLQTAAAGEINKKTTENKENNEKTEESTYQKIKKIIFKPKFNPQIIQSIINLRTNSNNKDKTKTAALITEINTFIESRDSVLSKDPWQNILDCVYVKCDDELYLRLIDSIILEDNNKQSNLIHYIIQAAIFWDTKNTIFFSETLTNANALIIELDNKDIEQQWNSIVQCDKKCTDFYDKIFGIIESISKIE